MKRQTYNFSKPEYNNETFYIGQLENGFKIIYEGNLSSLAKYFKYSEIDSKRRKCPKSIGSLIVALNKDKINFRFYIPNFIEVSMARNVKDNSYRYVNVERN